jgi:CBS domain-containing protein
MIDRDELSPIERSMIGQAVREINAIARRMHRVALRAAPLPRPTRRKAT